MMFGRAMSGLALMIAIVGAARVAAAETVTVRPLRAADAPLAQAIETKLASAHVLRPSPPSEMPVGLAHAIETFSAGDCASASVEIAEVARTTLEVALDDTVRGRVALWHAAILQRCDRIADANVVLDALLREQPAIVVDLTELWPSFAELVDAARRRAKPRGDLDRALARRVREQTGSEVIVIATAAADAVHVAIDRRGAYRAAQFVDADAATAWVAGALAPPRAEAVDVAVDLIPAAGRETKAGGERQLKLGSGLAARIAVRRGPLHVMVETLAVRYAAPEGELRGGWELGGALRIGGAVERAAWIAHGFAFVQAGMDRGGDDLPAMAANVTRGGIGVGGDLEVRATRRLRARVMGGWAPVGLVAVADAMGTADAGMSVNFGLRFGWQWSRAWLVDLGATLDQHETDFRAAGVTTHQSDMTIRLVLGARHTY